MKKGKIIKLLSALLIFIFILSACGTEIRIYKYIGNIRDLSECNYSLEHLIKTADKIVYAQVVSTEDAAEYFGAYYGDNTYSDICFTNHKMKVLKTFKGAGEDEICYRESGGKVGDTFYVNRGSGLLSKGDKAVLFLTENNTLVGAETTGRFKETFDGSFYVNKNILNKGLYKENNLKKAKLDKETFFSFIEKAVNDFGSQNNEDKENIYSVEKISQVGNLESLYRGSENVVYGEVISIGECDIYDINAGNYYTSDIKTYIKRDVKIKVLDKIKGNCGGTVIYHQPGGEKNGKVFEFNALESLNVGDKVIIFLTGSGLVRFEKGLLIEDENGMVTPPSGEIDVKEYISLLKEKFKEYKEKVEKEQADRIKNKNKEATSTDSCYAADPFDIDVILNGTDLIIMGDAEVGRKDIGYNINKNALGLGFCCTEVKVQNVHCVYNRYGSCDMKEFTYLQYGGEFEGVKYERDGYAIDESAKVIAFLKFDGVNYLVERLFYVKADGTVSPVKSSVPYKYREIFAEDKSAENYCNILSSYIKEVE